MKKLFVTGTLILLLSMCFACSGKGKSIEDVEQIRDNKYSCTYDGIKHEFMLELPETAEGAPLIVMLHGYGDSGEGFRSTTHLERTANEKGMAVVYVNGAPNPNDLVSARGWNSGIGGEGNDDVGFLKAFVKYLQKEYSLDASKTYVVGFSNGAFMVHRLAMEANDTFSGFVSVAGKMPESVWNSKNAKNNIKFFQITGEKDDVVPKKSDGSDAYAKDPAIEDVIDYYVSSNGLELSETVEIGEGSVINKYSKDGSDNAVWDLFVKDGRHTWPTEKTNGVDANAVIIEFLTGE